ncbi:hypothetical protein M4578_07460 [Salipiger sp. P9]|uniref:hypothetical protein n=1 Tax=Salipiger pentaromativorans TaxID=2943193 RepID=UPI0021579B5A|nr:hypothetical protein [Salipiger pentaromativorans]MCR8547662.1 hypothetical protein [Salipiger pentaromativorans]
MIRPEAQAALSQWREALFGAGVLALGLYWAFFTGGGLLHWIGYVVAIAGILLLIAGIQRGRFRVGSGGPGIVQVVEGRITYFGPLSGGVADLDGLTALTLDPGGKPAHWLLHQTGQPPLAIPLTAEGADALFDAFATLPGLQTERMLAEMRRASKRPVTIWQAASCNSTHLRLH